MSDKKEISRRGFLGGALAAGAMLGQGCASGGQHAFSIVPRHVLGGAGFYAAERKAQRRLRRGERHGHV